MNPTRLIESLKAFGNLLPVFVEEISESDAKWKPVSGNWSILEIVCHLHDEEVDDFGVRLQLTLEQHGVAWPPWDPEGSASSRKYNERSLQDSVARFVEVRKKSVAWLEQLSNVDWETGYQHPKMGRMTAGQLLGSWVAHDQLHVRQIAKRKFELIKRDAEPFDVSYAGEW